MKDLDFLISQLRETFLPNGNAKIAEGMSAYMKQLFPFCGIKKPLRTELEKPFIFECNKLGEKEIRYIVHQLWQLPEREFQYTVLVLLRKTRYWKFEESLSLFEWLIENKSWWDTVDAIAAHMIGPYFLKFPAKRDAQINTWLSSDNMWLQRTCIIFQLTYKEKTDVPYLLEILKQFTGEKEFFIKKAVGWALRQLSYTHPQVVIEFCENEPLQPLSFREALKALKREGKV